MEATTEHAANRGTTRAAVTLPTAPHDPEDVHLPDPTFPKFDAIREAGALTRRPNGDGYIAATYEVCSAVLRDVDSWSNNPMLSPLTNPSSYAASSVRDGGNNLLNCDAPDHTRIRALVSKGFTRRSLQNIRDGIHRKVEDFADQLESVDPVASVRSDLAFELPVTTVCDLIGFPLDDKDRVAKWSEPLARLLDAADPDPEATEALNDAIDYVAEVWTARQQDPRDDLLTSLVHAEWDGEGTPPPGRATGPELMTLVILLVLAGHDTVMTSISRMIEMFSTHPAQWDLVAADPSVVAGAAEEVLRMEPPANRTVRFAAHDGVTVNDVEFRRGDRLYVLFAAANYDPAVNPNPHTFDVRRPDPKHLSFSAGAHYCLGAQLARMQLRALLEVLPRRFSAPELLDPVVASPGNYPLRGVHEYRARFLPRPHKVADADRG